MVERTEKQRRATDLRGGLEFWRGRAEMKVRKIRYPEKP